MPSQQAARKSRRRQRRLQLNLQNIRRKSGFIVQEKIVPKRRKCGCNTLRTHTGDPNAICLVCREKDAGREIKPERKPTKTMAGLCDCCMEAKLFPSNRRICTRQNCKFQMCSECHAKVMSMHGARAGRCPQCNIFL